MRFLFALVLCAMIAASAMGRHGAQKRQAELEAQAELEERHPWKMTSLGQPDVVGQHLLTSLHSQQARAGVANSVQYETTTNCPVGEVVLDAVSAGTTVECILEFDNGIRSTGVLTEADGAHSFPVTLPAQGVLEVYFTIPTADQGDSATIALYSEADMSTPLCTSTTASNEPLQWYTEEDVLLHIVVEPLVINNDSGELDYELAVFQLCKDAEEFAFAELTASEDSGDWTAAFSFDKDTFVSRLTPYTNSFEGDLPYYVGAVVLNDPVNGLRHDFIRIFPVTEPSPASTLEASNGMTLRAGESGTIVWTIRTAQPTAVMATLPLDQDVFDGVQTITPGATYDSSTGNLVFTGFVNNDNQADPEAMPSVSIEFSANFLNKARDYTVDSSIFVQDGPFINLCSEPVTIDIRPAKCLMEVHTVEATQEWAPVETCCEYDDPIVLATLHYANNCPEEPVITRICDVQSDRFNLRLQRPGDCQDWDTADNNEQPNWFTDLVDNKPSLLPENVTYIVVERGEHMIDSIRIRADSVMADGTDWKNNMRGVKLTDRIFPANYKWSPVVIGHTQTCNDERWSAFWYTFEDTGLLTVGQHVGTDKDRERNNEELGYVVIEGELSGQIAGVDFIAGHSDRFVQGVWNNRPNPPPYLQPTPVDSVRFTHGVAQWEAGPHEVNNVAPSNASPNGPLSNDDTYNPQRRSESGAWAVWFGHEVSDDQDRLQFALDKDFFNREAGQRHNQNVEGKTQNHLRVHRPDSVAYWVFSDSLCLRENPPAPQSCYLDLTAGNDPKVTVRHAYAQSIKPVAWPQDEFTVSYWMRSDDSHHRGVAFSYAEPHDSTEPTFDCDNSAGMERCSYNGFTVANYKNMKVYVADHGHKTFITLNDGEWHHISISWRRSTGELVVYVDCEVRHKDFVSDGRIIMPGGTLVLGNDQDANANVLMEPMVNQPGAQFIDKAAFIGCLDNVVVYDQALSPQGIRDNCNLIPDENTPNTVVVYNFDDCVYTRGSNFPFSRDLAGGANDLRLGPQATIAVGGPL